MQHSLRYRRGQAGIATILLILVGTSIFMSLVYVTYELISYYESERQKISQLETERLEENIIIEKIGQGLGTIHLNITNVGAVPVLVRYAIVVYVEGGELKFAYDEVNVYLNIGESLYNVKLDISPPTNLKYIILVTSRGRSFIKVVETTSSRSGGKI